MSDMSQDPSSIPPPPAGQRPPPPTSGPAGPPPPGTGPAAAPPPPGYAPTQTPYGGPPQQNAGVPTKDEKTMAMLIHVLVIFTGFIGPLIIWVMKRDESAFIDRHGKTALNFSITLTIGYFVSAILILVLIGILMILVLLVVGIVFPIIAAMAANRGDEYTYPLTIPFIK